MYMSFEEQLNLIKPVWRVLVVILVFQLLGSMLYVINDVKGVLFFNLWYGAAYATPIGFIIGLVWHISAVKNGFSEYKTVIVILILGLMSLTLPLVGYFSQDTFLINQVN